MGASNAGGVDTNHDSGQIAGYRSVTAGRANNDCDRPPCSLPIGGVIGTISTAIAVPLLSEVWQNLVLAYLKPL